MNKYRAAVLGLGFIGPQHIDAILRVPQAELAAVCCVDEPALRRISERYGVPGFLDWRTVIDDPTIDVIHNCLPVDLHQEVNLAAIRAGKHVYSEKPLATSLQQAREVVLEAEKYHVRTGLNHQYRMNAAVQEMRARVQKGLTGQVLAVNGCYLQESAARATDWNVRMENTGIARVVTDIGTHWADTATHVLGQPIVRVMADLHIHHPVRTDAAGNTHPMHTEDTAFILVRFADGTPGSLTVSKAACGHKNDFQVTVWGSENTLNWQQETPDRLYIGTKEGGMQTFYLNPLYVQPETKPYITIPAGHVMGWPDALRNAVQSFYDSLDDDGTTPYPYATLKDGFAHQAFAEACVRSSREGHWVEVEQW